MSLIREFLPQIITSAIVIIAVPLAKYIAKKIISKYSTVSLKTEGRIEHIKHVISILINFTGIFTIAIVWGVKPENMLITLSSIFAVIGVAMFAQWSILSNITAGIILFFSTHFRIGDRIHIIDKDMPIEATIETIQTFYTYLRTTDNELIVLPNNLFLQKMVSVKKDKENA